MQYALFSKHYTWNEEINNIPSTLIVAEQYSPKILQEKTQIKSSTLVRAAKAVQKRCQEKKAVGVAVKLEGKAQVKTDEE